MLKSVYWFIGSACLTLIMGPLTLVASQAGQVDRADLYFILDGGGSSFSQRGLQSYGAVGVGPLRGKMAQMIHAPPHSRLQLLKAGYILLPADTLAAICGINTDLPSL